MYKISENENFDFLNGQEVVQICLSQHQVTINFSEEISLSIMGSFEHDGKGKKSLSGANISSQGARLVSLLNSQVESAERKSESELVIVFSNGEKLLVLDDSDQFETICIVGPDIEIVT